MGSKTLQKVSCHSKSSPALAAAFSLRQYSSTARHISGAKAAEPPAITYGRIDEIGGNGRWRQKRAAEYFARKAVEDAEAERLERIKREEKARRRRELEERRRRHQEEMDRKDREERERRRREAEERERQQREAEERERRRREAEERERQRRAPKMCQTCMGTGHCQVCMGKGTYFSMFLVSAVDPDSILEYGKKTQGCGNCGGYAQGVRGDVLKGSGRCPACKGQGKIWPVIDDARSPNLRLSHKDTLQGEVKEDVDPFGTSSQRLSGSAPKVQILKAT